LFVQKFIAIPLYFYRLLFFYRMLCNLRNLIAFSKSSGHHQPASRSHRPRYISLIVLSLQPQLTLVQPRRRLVRPSPERRYATRSGVADGVVSAVGAAPYIAIAGALPDCRQPMARYSKRQLVHPFLCMNFGKAFILWQI
jgi:hypothetical protein